MKYYSLLWRLGKLTRKPHATFYNVDDYDKYYNNNETLDSANKILYDALLNEKPLMISRYGSVELEATLNIFYNEPKSNLKKSLDYLLDKRGQFWWSEYINKPLQNNAGFFPIKKNNVKKFSSLMRESSKFVDILGLFQGNEDEVPELPKDRINLHLTRLDPYFSSLPWTKALEGKKILVVHNLEDDIKSQYNRKHLIWPDKEILPEFELKTIKAVQSIAGEDCGFDNWFDALMYMQSEIEKIDFDIAIIGCGAYGFPLAAFVKKMGKKAFHYGGATQLLFGIRGKRWDDNAEYAALYNDSWIYPSKKPTNFKTVEGGCYW